MKKWIRIEIEDLAIIDNIVKELICDNDVPLRQTEKLCRLNEILAGVWMQFQKPRRNDMKYRAESKIDGKLIEGTLMIEGLNVWIATETGKTAVWLDTVEEVQEEE